MNVARFYERWGIAEDPFRAEEARQDAVFRMLSRPDAGVTHPDFAKIAGQADLPTTSIVFGEKGSGKTAIRLQIEASLREHNAREGVRSAVLVAYDDLNPLLGRLAARAGKGGAPEAFKTIRLSDHMDAILRVAMTGVTDALLGEGDGAGSTSPFAPLRGERKRLRALEPASRIDLLALQAVYDGSPRAAERTRLLRKAFGLRGDRQTALWAALAVLAWALPAAVGYGWWRDGGNLESRPWLIAMASAVALAGLATLKKLVWDPGAVRLHARRILSHARAIARPRESLTESLGELSPLVRDSGLLPVTEAEEPRFAMFERLRRALSGLGVGSVIIVVDRVDEPTLVSGEPDRMRALVWPLLNNKFLQMEGYGVKLLLPIELRYALFRESTAFFQEARLDKQSLIERLNWTGATLYDLCTARLQACSREGRSAGEGGAAPAEAGGENASIAPSGRAPISLRDLFEEDVARGDLIAALDHMKRPRDAFKLLYRCVQEHCASVTDEEQKFRIPKVLLETVAKREQERVEQLARGVRPA